MASAEDSISWKLLYGSSVFSGILLGFVLDKIKTIKYKETTEENKGNSVPELTRKNSLAKYFQRKASGVPIQYNRMKLSKKPKNTNPNNSLVQELNFLDAPTCEIFKVDHLCWNLEMYDFPDILSPLMGDSKFRTVYGGEGFLPEESFVAMNSFVLSVCSFGPSHSFDRTVRWLRAGPRKYLFFKPEEVKAVILTGGGLYPGVNVVIREITMSLYFNYKVREIYGIQFGFKGINKYEWKKLDPEVVESIHNYGGSILGSAHLENPDIDSLLEGLLSKGVNHVYVIGGRDTIQIFINLYKEITKRNLKIAISLIPKTLGNDLPIIDSCFGFESCIEMAQKAIRAAYVESHCAEYGVGIVKLFGKISGILAMTSCLASIDVNICLVPEFGFELYGKNGLLEYICQRLRIKRHCIIVVAEGASNAMLDDEIPADSKIDIGQFLRNKIIEHGKAQDLDITVRYIDPNYMIRSIEANSYDKTIATRLAQHAVHCAMAGFTGTALGLVNRNVVMIPGEEILSDKYANQILPNDRTWQRLLGSTGQPSFITDEFKYVRMEKKK